MSLIEHIRELRNRVLKALLAASVGAVAGWFLEPAVWKVIQAPYCKLPMKLVGAAVPHGTSCPLYVTGLFDSLFLRLKLAIAIGIIIAAPIWLYQLWAFLAPGLHARERRWAYFFAGAAIPLFAMGGAIAYFAMTKGLRFLLSVVPHNVVPIITINTYLGYASAMLLIFGLAFELPLVMILLNVAGILTHQRFAKWRRMIVFGVFAFAAVATPSPDPISMLLLAVPCVVLVEAAEVFAWANDRRRARRGVVYPGLTPEEISEYGLDSEPAMAPDFDDIEAGR
ncbi:MAG TPA: twin-arginine translocase subunit TatC [Streptosporangiaceae bacterium]|nr:twin-arginine translocase subunit TatC [Streptosporangiaceae bacterium]